ncbi:hypothetical protein NMY22_g517 [Coprinellus aureogranulatus]|nr:hypothetical protein NMY22_g517 [Coprinellus aureogranulatus]
MGCVQSEMGQRNLSAPLVLCHTLCTLDCPSASERPTVYRHPTASCPPPMDATRPLAHNAPHYRSSRDLPASLPTPSAGQLHGLDRRSSLPATLTMIPRTSEYPLSRSFDLVVVLMPRQDLCSRQLRHRGYSVHLVLDLKPCAIYRFVKQRLPRL